jgi:hypothetical protein
MTLLEELQPALATLLHRRGCRLIEERRDASFGNAVVVAECEGFLIRAARDRGEIAIEFNQLGGEQWHSAEHVLEFVVGRAADDLLGALEANFRQVAELMSSDLVQSGYTDFEKRKADSIIRRLFPHANVI